MFIDRKINAKKKKIRWKNALGCSTKCDLSSQQIFLLSTFWFRGHKNMWNDSWNKISVQTNWKLLTLRSHKCSQDQQHSVRSRQSRKIRNKKQIVFVLFSFQKQWIRINIYKKHTCICAWTIFMIFRTANICARCHFSPVLFLCSFAD